MSYRTNAAPAQAVKNLREPTDYECDCIIAECMVFASIDVVAEDQIDNIISAHHGERWCKASIRAMALQVRARWFRDGKRAVVREAFRHARGVRR